MKRHENEKLNHLLMFIFLKRTYCFSKVNKQIFLLIIIGFIFFFNNTSAQENSNIENNIPKMKGFQEKLNSCECYQYVEKQLGYMPFLKTLNSYESFTNKTGWKYAGIDNFYENVFFKNLQTTLNRRTAFYSFTTISNKQIQLLHPDSTFAINMTPCTNENKIYELPINIIYEHSIKEYISDFDYELFDRTAKSYFEVILNIIGDKKEEILYNVLYIYEKKDIQSFISNINSKYHTKIELDSLSKDNNISNILAEFERKNVDFSNFILNEFILTENSNHIINDDEKDRMLNIFNDWFGYITIESIDKIIYPQINATFENKNINIEIDKNIIRKWDTLKNKPMKMGKSKCISTNILAEISSFKYSTSDGVDIQINNLCVNQSEITGTGILLNFSNGYLISSQKQHYNHLEYYNYPLFITDSSFYMEQPMVPKHNIYVFDSLLTNFTGLLVQNATINIPYKRNVITVNGLDIILNNKFISGKIIFKTIGLSETKNKSSEIKIVIDENTIIKTTIIDLEKHFKKNGINNIKFVKDEEQLIMYFLKYCEDIN